MSEFDGDMDISTMKVADLKKELRRRGLSVEGKEQELMERLLLDGTRNKSGGPGEDFLGEDEANTLLNAEDEASSNEKSALDDEDEEVLIVEPPKKKVAINRDINIPSVPSLTDASSGDLVKKDTPSNGNGAKISDEERSQARKERFGIQTPATDAAVAAPTSGASEGDKKAARAARFGSSSLTSEPVPVDMEKLKQRTERFGQVNSSTIKKLEDAERIKTRQERFGIVTKDLPLKKVSTGVSDPANEERLKKRAERFGVGSSGASSSSSSSKEEEEKKKMRSLRFGVATSS
uniref:Nuclear protein Hcc-1 n=1 Tax=Caligus clemensi TaxID=344056 RepID=C1C2T4_CALCM|nr:Nuclear protein Hcc-1 [Caligus clemensi]